MKLVFTYFFFSREIHVIAVRNLLVLYFMELDGRGFPSSDLTSDAFLIEKKFFLKAQALKWPGRDLQAVCQ